MPERSQGRSEILQGTLDMLILSTLRMGRAHGHQIAKHLQRTTDDVLQVEHGSLYPALHRLERKGWVVAKWELAAKDSKRELTLAPATRQEIIEDRRGVSCHIFIGPGVPSDQLGTGAMNTVTGSRSPPPAIMGTPGRFAPHAAASVWGRKNIRCGCQWPSASLK